MEENIILNFEEQKKKIEDNLNYMKHNISKMQEPIFIELLGTPKSGKTTLLNKLRILFEKANIPFEAKQETAEYNPIENKDLEEYNIWMIAELIKNLSEDISSKRQKIIVYDRGVLDRIPWLDCEVKKGNMSVKDQMILKSLYNVDFMKQYKPLSYGFITSPEISVQRKGKLGRLVNVENLTVFNEYFIKETDFMKSYSGKYQMIDTDKYQGEINQFIMDMTEKITADIKDRITERKFETVEKEETTENER